MSEHPQIPNGRGARSNPAGRYERQSSQAFDDGWNDQDAPVPKLNTEVTAERARTIITRNQSPDIHFDRSINPYRGCEHGCIYCYARPAHAYVGLSPGLDFESRLFFKADAARLLAEALAHPSYTPRPIHIGGNTDPYQPIETRLKVTRGLLEVLERFHHPFTIITKSASILRDCDILARMSERGLAGVYVSVTTLDRKLARSMEPRASTPSRRLDALRRLSDLGVRTGVGFAPVIPGLNDHEMENILEAAARAGASSCMYVMLRLPAEVRDLFEEWLLRDHPDRAARVLSLVRQTQGRRDYDSSWGARMVGRGPVADLVAQRFAAAVRRYGLDHRHPTLRTDLFRKPRPPSAQPDLFG